MSSSQIAALNDATRRALAGLVLTSGVTELCDEAREQVLRSVANYIDFTPDNDPHGEHDFGSFYVHDDKLFWKIDYYAKDDFERGSDDPADPARTSRVLTIMLASEY